MGLDDMTRSGSGGVDAACDLVVGVEDAWIGAGQDAMQTGWVGEAEEADVRLTGRGADDGDRLGHHDLVPGVGVQVATAEEAVLARVGVDPAEDEEIAGVAEGEHGGFVGGVACVGGGGLRGDEQVRGEQGVGDQGAAEDAARFEIVGCVAVGEGEEGGEQGGGQEECAERGSGFGGVGCGEAEG